MVFLLLKVNLDASDMFNKYIIIRKKRPFSLLWISVKGHTHKSK